MKKEIVGLILLVFVSSFVFACSLADNNPIDGVVSINELISYISQWKLGDVNIGELITAISEWKSGCTACIPTTEICNDLVDNDCDTLIDALDILDCPVQNNLKLWFKFDDSLSDGITEDSSGNTNGTCTACPVFISGYYGNAYLFQGVDEVVLSSQQSITRTITFWLNLTSYDPYNNAYIYFSPNQFATFTGGNLAVKWLDGSSISKTYTFNGVAPQFNSWTFYAISYDVSGTTTNISVYRDGSIVDSNWTNDGLNPGSIASIGRRTGTLHFLYGTLDDFRMYNKVLNQNEIITVMNNGDI